MKTEETPFVGELYAREGCPYIVMHREGSRKYTVHVAGIPAPIYITSTLEDALAMADAEDRDCEEGALPGRGRY